MDEMKAKTQWYHRTVSRMSLLLQEMPQAPKTIKSNCADVFLQAIIAEFYAWVKISKIEQ